MNLNIKEIAGSDVSSRTIAAALRAQVLESEELCTVDFDGVRSVSSSFADELLGVLVRDNGEKWFVEHLRIRGVSPEIKYTILEAIDARIPG